MIGILSSSQTFMHFSSGSSELVVVFLWGIWSLDEASESVVIRSSEFHGKTNGLGLTLKRLRLVGRRFGGIWGGNDANVPSRIYVDLPTNMEVAFIGPNMELNAMAVSLRDAERGQPRLNYWPTLAVNGPPTANRPLCGQSATKSPIPLTNCCTWAALPLPVPMMVLTPDFPAILLISRNEGVERIYIN